MNILIVEDDLLIAEMLKRMLKKLDHHVIEIFTSYEDTIQFMTANSNVDLVFLDINLEKEKSGIDIGTELKNKFKISFIYLTSYSDPSTIKNASKTLPESYLTKPFNEVQLFTSLEIIQQKLNNKLKSIIINDGGKKIKLSDHEILFIKSDKNYLEVRTINKRYVIRKTLEDFLLTLDDEFFTKSHRSYAVNTKLISKIKNQIIFINEFEIPLSRKYKENVMHLFMHT